MLVVPQLAFVQLDLLLVFLVENLVALLVEMLVDNPVALPAEILVGIPVNPLGILVALPVVQMVEASKVFQGNFEAKSIKSLLSS